MTVITILLAFVIGFPVLLVAAFVAVMFGLAVFGGLSLLAALVTEWALDFRAWVSR